MEVDLKVHGLDELERKLLKLGAEVGEKELYKALMSSSLLLYKRTKALAPEGKTGNLKRSIKRRRFRTKKTRALTLRGVSGGQKNTAAGVYLIADSKIAPHAHLIHEGTQLRATKGKGRKIPYKNANRGLTPRNQFMLKAWKAEGGQKVVDKFAQKLRRNLAKYER